MTPRLRVLVLLAAPLACVIDNQLDDGDTGAADTDADATATADATDGTDGTAIAFADAPAALAAARCGAYFGCECNALFEAPGWGTQAECEASMFDVFAAELERGAGLGLQYDPSCVARYVEFYAGPECGPTSADTAAGYSDVLRCMFMHGESGVGETCEGTAVFLPGASACAADLVCIDDGCESEKAAGDPCESAGTIGNDCAWGMFCDPSTAPPRCAPLRAVGDHCDDDERCVANAYCRDEVCTASRAAGESCTFATECDHGLCDATGTCIAVPAACSPWGIEVQTSCDVYELAAQDFIEDSSACDDVSDCVAVDALCYPGNTCGQVALAADYDVEAWTDLYAGLEAQCTECGGDPCGVPLDCVDDRCVLQF